MRIDEKARVYADRDWWRSAGDVVGLELRGWTFRNEASFADRDTGRSVEMPGWLAERIIANVLSPGSTGETEGWVLVPAEPTPEMIEAALNAGLDIYWSYKADGRDGGPEGVYRAMLAAAGGKTGLGE